MTDIMDRTAAPPPPLVLPYVQWGPVFAGALAAAALASVLHTFAGAIGLAVSSTAPTWRDASIALWILSGLYLVLVALAAYGLGGYVAGRMRSRWHEVNQDEVEFRDGLHGGLVWAVGIVIGAAMLLATACAVSTGLPAASTMTSPPTSPFS